MNLMGLRKRILRMKAEGESAEERQLRKIQRIKNKAEREESLKNLKVARLRRQKEVAEAEVALSKANRARTQARKEVWDVRYAMIGSMLTPLRKGAGKAGRGLVRAGKKELKKQRRKARVKV